MPLIKYIKKSETVVAVWRVSENISYFSAKTPISEEESTEIATLHERRRMEWYASRYLLHLLSERDERIPITKDDCGKPFLYQHHYHISVSHSRQYVAVIASPHVVGVDIQVYVPKITRIKKKFVSEYEMTHHDHDDIKVLHLLWGAKEAMYKAYGKRGLDFREHMCVSSQDDEWHGHVRKGDIDHRYTLEAHDEGDFLLMLAVKRDPMDKSHKPNT